MKNLIVYPNNTIEVHLTAVERKNTGGSKANLISIEDNVRDDYSEYDNRFFANELNLIPKDPFYLPYKIDLQTLYDYQSRTITEFRGVIENAQIRTIRNTCQNCTINSVNTFDHVLPQVDFPQFIVNPKNLFPCCSQCNSYKSKYIESDGEKLFLNLYLDHLPEVQFLFVKFEIDDSFEIDFSYYLLNKYAISELLYLQISSHFNKLHLLDRMRQKANEIYSEIENEIFRSLKHLTLDSIFEDFTENIIRDQRAYGFNHWKCVLKLALIDNKEFREYIEEKYDELKN